MESHPARTSDGDSAVRTADRLHSAAIHLLRHLRRQDEAAALSAPTLSALSVIVFGGPVTIGELAAAEQVKPPTISRLVRKLEADGLVTRDSDVADRRVVRVRATARGTRLLREGRHRRVEALATQLRALDPAEFHALKRAVEILEQVLRQGMDAEH